MEEACYEPVEGTGKETGLEPVKETGEELVEGTGEEIG